ncbi:RHS repeat protein [Nonomuraea jiangxiensis]|uniref:YD repeat-containing protein n=1 Tax=Nonomuraea jiangxiensis TaxID=633440 RepID=A0A1G9N9R5_9ACTN|nr:RHS repeat protein [Nonomuraea jiangxiensis]SDL83160.1 YD repeat-containing protein [Nonomuraea jiangxiensis]
MISLDDLREAVDAHHAAVRFAVPLAQVPGDVAAEGGRVVLTYDSTRVAAVRDGWNLERPTGLAGLGWTLETSAITRDATGHRLRLDGADYRLIPSASGYAADPHTFWRVSYDAAAETWTIVREDGVRLLFGGDGAVDWGYTFNGWAGASVQTAGRTRVADAWWLVSRTDVWGNTTAYTYRQDTATLADGATYVRATYPLRITGPDGGRIDFGYADKNPTEYADPGDGSRARQSRYGTRALVTLDEVSPGGTTLTTTTLGYTAPPTGDLAVIGARDREKRLLVSLTRSVPGGYATPGVDFGYDTSPVSPSYGLLLRVTTPAGGVAEFAYAAPAVTRATRDLALTPPAGTGAAEPKVAFGEEFAVVLWPRADSTVSATAYRWQGRWVPHDVPVPQGTLATLTVVTGPRCFAVVGAAAYTLFHADPETPDGWIGSAAAEPTGLPQGEPVAAAAADGAIALLGTRAGTMTVRWFDGAAWQRLPCPAPAGTTLAALDGRDGTITRLCAATSAAEQSVTTVRRDPAAGWAATTTRIRSWAVAPVRAAVVQGAGFAVLTCEGWSGPDRTATWLAVRQDGPARTTVTTAVLGEVTGGAAAPAVSTRGDAVLIGQVAYRYDGTGWRRSDLSLLTRQGTARPVLGADVVCRATTGSGGTVYDLIAYDPATATWSYVPEVSGMTAASGALAAGTGRYALVGTGLYLRGANGVWALALDLSQALARQATPGLFGESHVLYETSAGVTAIPLEPGEPGTAINLAGARLAAAGPAAFATSTGTWGTDAVLRLHRVVAGDVRGTITPAQVTSVTLYGSGRSTDTGPDSAYNRVPVGYLVDPATATVSPDGQRVAAARVTIAPGTADAAAPVSGRTVVDFFNGLSAAEAAGLDRPTGSATNAAAHLSRLPGTPYAQAVYRQDSATPVSRTTMWWWVTTTRSGPRDVGGWARCREDLAEVDGAPLRSTHTYDELTGLMLSTARAEADGRLVRADFTHWWRAYDPDRTLNLLSPVVLTLTSADGVRTGGEATTWSDDWGEGPGRWAQRATYRATTAEAADFTAWREGSVVPAGWEPAHLVATRTPDGRVTGTRDAIGLPGSTLYGPAGSAAFAAADCAAGEAHFYGCEPGEDPGPWRYREAGGASGPVQPHLVAGESQLGSGSLAVVADPAGAAGPYATFVPAGQDRAYLFSCWAQTGPGYVEGNARVEIDVTALGDPPTPLGDPIRADLPVTGGTWQYVSATIPLATLLDGHPGTTASLRVRVVNTAADTPTGPQVMVDGLRLQPLDAAFHAEVHDPATGLPRGTLGPNGATTRLVRDGNRVVTATIGPDRGSARLRVPGFARLLTPDGSYAENLPNTLLEVTSGGDVEYHDFESSDAGLWTLPSGWTMGGGRLAFDGTGGGTYGSRAVLKDFAAADVAAYVRVLPQAQPERRKVGIGCGNVLVSHDDATGQWSLAYDDGGTWRTAVTRQGAFTHGDLVFSILDGRVSCFAGGRQILSHRLGGVVPDGTLGLYLSGPGAFADLVALAEPELRFTLCDARGLPQQSLDVRDAQNVEAHGLLYDDVGRPSYDKNPVLAPVHDTGDVIGGGVAGYLPGGVSSVAEYKAPGHGAPFVQVGYEKSPLERPVALGLPGDELAVNGGRSTSLTVARNSATGAMAGAVPDAQADGYRLVTLTEADGATALTLTTADGRVHAERRTLNDGTKLTTCYDYDGAGRLCAIRPPGSAGGGTGGTTTYTYDFLGRVTSTDSPQSGTTRYAYDRSGRLRFTQDAADAAATPARIGYRKLDRLGRIVEAGVITDPALTWETAAGHADDPAWPGTGVTFQAHRAFTFDTAGEGRLAQVVTGAGATAVTEHYTYDARGSVVRYRVAVPGFDDHVWESAYSYDSRGRLTGIDLPKAVTDGEPPLRVTYSYDRSGRVAAIGTPPDDGVYRPLGAVPDTSATFARYTYNPDGTPSSIVYADGNVPVTLEYTAAGWPSKITAPAYEEEATYTQGGHPGPGGFHDGKVASTRSRWSAGPDAPYPLRETTTRYGYDTAGRMIAAVPYLGGAHPVGYDPDGNLTTVGRDDAVATYRYQPGERLLASTPPAERVLSIETALGTGFGFEEDDPPPGWSWGRTNLGPDGPSVEAVTGGPPSSTRCLRLPGAVPGGSSYLEYRSRFDLRGTYTVTYYVAADPAPDGRTGEAGWYVNVHGPLGPIGTRLVHALDNPSATWTSHTFTLDLSTLADLAPGWNIADIALTLVNGRASALRVDNVSIAGVGASGPIGYDAAGRITALPTRGLDSIAYTPEGDLASVHSDGVCPYDSEFTWGDSTVCTLATPAGDGATNRTLDLRSPGGLPLARLESVTDGTGATTMRRLYFVPGPGGVVAVSERDSVLYPIPGVGGTIKAVVNDKGRLVQYIDRDAFGAPEGMLLSEEDLPLYDRSVFDPGLVDPLTGLVLTRRGTYDPVLGRTVAPAVDPCGPTPPPAPPGPPGPAYGEGLFGWVRNKVDAARFLARLHLKKSWQYLEHVYPGYPGYDTHPFTPLVAHAALSRLPVSLVLAGYGVLSAAATALPLGYGMSRFALHHWWWNKCPEGMYRIAMDPLAEDIYHLQFYGPMEAIGGKALQPRAVHQIPDGYYIFVVDESKVFRYCEMYDRAGGHELYVRHSMLNSGGCARTAGMMRVDSAQREIMLTNSSGHYQPSVKSLEEWARPALIDAGYADWSIPTCDFNRVDLKTQMAAYVRLRPELRGGNR